jgi:Carboxypeptidase regulatory-like domain
MLAFDNALTRSAKLGGRKMAKIRTILALMGLSIRRGLAYLKQRSGAALSFGGQLTMAQKTTRLAYLATAVLVFMNSVAARPQGATTNGTITGFVSDSSGSVIVNASVTATNVLTGQATTKQTDSMGRYEFVDLPFGNYDVRAEHPGFETTLHSGVVVHADSNNRVDFALAVGSESQQVTVSAAAVQVNTETAEVGETITSKLITDLPLNGRDAGSLVTLTPGNSGYQMVNWWGFNTTFVTAGGSYFQNRSTEWLLDGGIYTWTFVNSGAQLPNPDALEEFHYGLNERSAEYGRMGSATVNAVIKSGTNQFHGDVWEFNRNNGLNAKPYLDSARNSKLVQNQFGFTAGGPIFRNRTFFFGSYEGYRQAGTGFISDTPVLTTQERSGNFSDLVASIPNGQLTDPVNGTPYGGNVVPVNPVSANIMKWIPSPNTTSASGLEDEWSGNVPARSNSDQYLVKLNHRLTSKHEIEGSYFHLGGAGESAQGSNFQATDPAVTSYFDHQFEEQWNAADIWTISASKINTARFVFFGIGSPRGWTQSSAADTLQGLGATFTSAYPQPPDVCVNGYFSLDCTNVGTISEYDGQYMDTFRWALKRHQLSMGGSYMNYHDNQFTSPGPWVHINGGIQYSDGVPGNSTGNALADFALGLTSYVQYGYPNFFGQDQVQNLRGAFVEDEWHIAKRLSLSLGLRWELLNPARNVTNDSVQFLPGAQSKIFPDYIPGWLFRNPFTGAQDPGYVPRGGIVYPNRYDPRVGFAWDVFGNGKTALRGGSGIFESQTESISYGPGNSPFTSPSPSCWPGQANLVSISNPYGPPTGPYSGPQTCDPIQASKTWTGPPANYSAPEPYSGGGFDPATSRPYVIDYSLGIEQQLTPSTLLDVTYVGQMGRYLWFNVDYYGGSPYFPGANTSNIAQRYPYLNNGALAACEANSSSTQCTTLLAAPALVQQVWTQGSTDNSSYNGLLVQVNHRMGHGITFTNSFTYSHELDANHYPAQNQALREHGRYGTGESNIKFNWVSSWTYAPMFHFSDRIARNVVNGWELAGIAQFESGPALDVWTGVDDIYNTPNGSSETLVNRIGDFKLSAHRPRAAEMHEWFNTGAAANPGVGHIGNSGWDPITSPGLKNFNMSLLRDFNITEHARFQFHFDTFNTFNFVNLSGANGTMTSPQFGQITSAGSMRQLQMGAKIYF